MNSAKVLQNVLKWYQSFNRSNETPTQLFIILQLQVEKTGISWLPTD